MAGTRRYAKGWIALALCAAVAGVVATAATARPDARAVYVATTGPTAPIATGLGDPMFGSSQRATAFSMAHKAGATYARLLVSWSSIAPKTLPASGFNPANPASPYYRWSALDATVSAANAAGITPILDIGSTPSWAYNVKPGSWTGGSPKIGALGAFASAVAARYDGSAPPLAHVFSVWNEPNFNKNLYPQDPTYYRAMVNAVSDAVHRVDPSDLVAAGELASFRHLPGVNDRNQAIPPLTFMRSMLCLSNTSPVYLTCHKPARFDVWTHHPYSNNGPYGLIQPTGSVQLGNLPAMTHLLQNAQRLGAIVSAQPVQFWVTEVGWSSNPPNKHGTPIGLESRWMSETMYQMWKSGVTLGTWFLLMDQPRGTPFQSGLYFRSTSLTTASAKQLLPAFRFPFVAYVKSPGQIQIWGRNVTSNVQPVTIEQGTTNHGPWRTVATITSNSYGIFRATLRLSTTDYSWLRASAPGSGTSLPFTLSVPSNENLSVTPFPPN